MAYLYKYSDTPLTLASYGQLYFDEGTQELQISVTTLNGQDLTFIYDSVKLKCTFIIVDDSGNRLKCEFLSSALINNGNYCVVNVTNYTKTGDAFITERAIFIDIENSFSVAEIDDIVLTEPVANNSVLKYNSTTAKWYNDTLASDKTIYNSDGFLSGDRVMDLNNFSLELGTGIFLSDDSLSIRNPIVAFPLRTTGIMTLTGLGRELTMITQPSGDIVGTTQSQALTNKTLSDPTNACRATQIKEVIMPTASTASNTGQVLRSTSTTTSEWIDNTLANLLEVQISIPLLNKNVLQYSTSVSRWINAVLPTPIIPWGQSTIYTAGTNTTTALPLNGIWNLLNLTGSVLKSNNASFTAPNFTLDAGTNRIIFSKLGVTNEGCMFSFSCNISVPTNSGDIYEIALSKSALVIPPVPLTGHQIMTFAGNNQFITVSFTCNVLMSTGDVIFPIVRNSSGNTRSANTRNVIQYISGTNVVQV